MSKIAIRTSIVGLLALPGAATIIKNLRARFPIITSMDLIDPQSYYPHLFYFKDEDIETIDGVTGDYSVGGMKIVTPEEFVATIFPQGVRKAKKRTKGVASVKRAVSKATIFFTGGTQYTIKGFEEVAYTAGGNLMFGTIAEGGETFLRYSNLWEFVVDDIESIVIRGVNKSFTITHISDFSARLSATDFEMTTTSFNFSV